MERTSLGISLRMKLLSEFFFFFLKKSFLLKTQCEPQWNYTTPF